MEAARSASSGVNIPTPKATEDHVRVLVRVRPCLSHELGLADVLPKITLQCSSDVMLSAQHPCRPNFQEKFPFDAVLWSVPADQSTPLHGTEFCGQQDVYRHIGIGALNSAFEGYNTTILAYGQTSSGKTYSIMGTSEEPGITPQLSQAMLDRVAAHEIQTTSLRHSTQETQKIAYSISMAYMEIYNERVRDLLDLKDDGHTKRVESKGLKVFCDPKSGPTVKGLSQKPVRTWKQVEYFLERGSSRRITATTALNDCSSRSHAIVQFTLVQDELLGIVGTKEVRKTRTSRISLVDLAGSEKTQKSRVEGVEFIEAVNVNKSLATLCRVIDSLVEGHCHTPYRDSTLTQILSDSIGGNARTAILATVSPAAVNFEETLATLRYASRIRRIVNLVKVNEDAAATLIRSLQAELQQLKQSLTNSSLSSTSNATLQARQQLSETEHLIETLRAREKQDKADIEARSQLWEAERLELQQRHAKALQKLGQHTEQLMEQQRQAEAQNDELAFLLQAQQEKGEQQKELLNATLVMVKQEEAEAIEQKEATRMELAASIIQTAVCKRRMKKVQEELNRMAKGEAVGRKCSLCEEKIACFTCVECDDEAFCEACDGKRHRALRSSHTREAITWVGANISCSLCLAQAATVLCEDCDEGHFCAECDEMKHTNPKRAHHQRRSGLRAQERLAELYRAMTPKRSGPSPAAGSARRSAADCENVPLSARQFSANAISSAQFDCPMLVFGARAQPQSSWAPFRVPTHEAMEDDSLSQLLPPSLSCVSTGSGPLGPFPQASNGGTLTVAEVGHSQLTRSESERTYEAQGATFVGVMPVQQSIGMQDTKPTVAAPNFSHRSKLPSQSSDYITPRQPPSSARGGPSRCSNATALLSTPQRPLETPRTASPAIVRTASPPLQMAASPPPLRTIQPVTSVADASKFFHSKTSAGTPMPFPGDTQDAFPISMPHASDPLRSSSTLQLSPRPYSSRKVEDQPVTNGRTSRTSNGRGLRPGASQEAVYRPVTPRALAPGFISPKDSIPRHGSDCRTPRNTKGTSSLVQCQDPALRRNSTDLLCPATTPSRDPVQRPADDSHSRSIAGKLRLPSCEGLFRRASQLRGPERHQQFINTPRKHVSQTPAAQPTSARRSSSNRRAPAEATTGGRLRFQMR